MSTDHTVQQSGDDIRRAQQRSLQKLRPPVQIPGYDLERFLGAGAFGEVWVGLERNTSRRVAIKFYTHRGGLDWTLLSREVEKLAFLFADRYVVQLVDVGWNSDPPYYVMEYLENGSLADRLEQGPIPVEEAVGLFRDVAVGLVHSHGKGVLHCDLKPANVLLDQDHKPRLADFGQSRLSHEQTPALGTLFYMAPEQADLQAVPDARWDVYALGTLLYCMLTGEPPHRHDESLAAIDRAVTLEEKLAVYARIIRESPRPRAHRRVPGVDRELADIVDRCLATNPHKRFANAQAVLDALNARAVRRTRRPLLILGAVGPALLLMVMSVFAWTVYGTAVQQSEAALTRRALETNSFAAQFVAETVASQVDRRWKVLEIVAADPTFREQLLAATGQPLGSPPRDALQRRVEALHNEYNALLATSWFIDDARGVQLARSPFSSATVDVDFSRRDYFHGHGRELPEGTKNIEPIRNVHRSLVFYSRATGQPMVAFSAPVWNEPSAGEGRRVIGILAITVELGDFAELQADGGAQLAVLVDSRADSNGRTGRILEHPELARTVQQYGNGAPPNTDNISRYYLDEANTRRIDRLRDTDARSTNDDPELNSLRLLRATSDYQDPVAGEYQGRWLAAFQPVWVPGRPPETRDTGWAVIVQERHDAAVAPARELGGTLFRAGSLALSVVVAVVTGLWVFVVVVLNESSRFRLIHLLRRRAGLPSTSLSTGSGSTGPSMAGRRSVGSLDVTEDIRHAAGPPTT